MLNAKYLNFILRSMTGKKIAGGLKAAKVINLSNIQWNPQKDSSKKIRDLLTCWRVWEICKDNEELKLSLNAVSVVHAEQLASVALRPMWESSSSIWHN